MFTEGLPCVLCGTKKQVALGINGCACMSCLGEAVKQALAKEHVPEIPSVTASDHCLFCDLSIANGFLAAAKGPYRICHACLVYAVKSFAVPINTTAFIQVNF